MKLIYIPSDRHHDYEDCTLYAARCTVYGVQCTVYGVHCTLGWITFFRINWLTQHIN